MGNVIWINGSFGAGKTTIAQHVVEELPDAFLLDPETIGAVLHDHLVPASLYPGDFQDLSLWRSFTRDAGIDAAERGQGAVVVPMTIARPDYSDEIIERIKERVRLEHFTLMASRDTILSREASRPDDTQGWAAHTVDRVLPELENDRYAQHLDAETQSPSTLAAEILRRVAVS